jgi:hypothetical protein
VFTGFTLSQIGLVVHWWRTRPPRWQHRATVNGIGAVVTGLATVVFLVTKFAQGAWVVVIAVPTFVYLFLRIHAYYKRCGREMGIGQLPGMPVGKDTLVIVPVTGVSRLAQVAISEALSLGQEVIAVSVVLDQGEEGQREDEALEHEWQEWDPGVELRILRTEYASVVQPIVAFIDEAREQSSRQIVVLIPVVVPERLRYRLLHNQIDQVLTAALSSRTDVVVARVRLPVQELAGETTPLTEVRQGKGGSGDPQTPHPAS